MSEKSPNDLSDEIPGIFGSYCMLEEIELVDEGDQDATDRLRSKMITDGLGTKSSCDECGIEFNFFASGGFLPSPPGCARIRNVEQ